MYVEQVSYLLQINLEHSFRIFLKDVGYQERLFVLKEGMSSDLIQT